MELKTSIGAVVDVMRMGHIHAREPPPPLPIFPQRYIPSPRPRAISVHALSPTPPLQTNKQKTKNHGTHPLTLAPNTPQERKPHPTRQHPPSEPHRTEVRAGQCNAECVWNANVTHVRVDGSGVLWRGRGGGSSAGSEQSTRRSAPRTGSWSAFRDAAAQAGSAAGCSVRRKRCGCWRTARCRCMAKGRTERVEEKTARQSRTRAPQTLWGLCVWERVEKARRRGRKQQEGEWRHRRVGRRGEGGGGWLYSRLFERSLPAPVRALAAMLGSRNRWRGCESAPLASARASNPTRSRPTQILDAESCCSIRGHWLWIAS